MKAALLFAAAVVFLPQASSSVELVARHAQGDVFEERENSWRSSSGTALDADGNKPSFEWSSAGVYLGDSDGDHTGESNSTILDEVLAVKDGKRVKVKRTFVVSSSMTLDTTTGESTPRRKGAAFEGQTAILVAEGDEVRIEGELEGAEELEESDLRLSSRWEQVLPGRPVEVGDSWSLSEDAAKSLLKDMVLTQATAWCTLDGVDARAEGRPARIKLELSGAVRLDGELEGTCEVKASGVALWSTAAGHLMEVALSGERKTTRPDGSEATSTFGISHEARKIE